MDKPEGENKVSVDMENIGKNYNEYMEKVFGDQKAYLQYAVEIAKEIVKINEGLETKDS